MRRSRGVRPRWGLFLGAALLALLVAGTVQAQIQETCCEGGARPNRRCTSDSECPNLCDGGARDGKQCKIDFHCPPACSGGTNSGAICVVDANCPDACVGGANHGGECTSGADCADACVGGSNDGGACAGDGDCPGGSCSNLGSCSNVGSCGNFGSCSIEGTCTATCFTRKFFKSPTNPASFWEEAPSSIEDLPRSVGYDASVCP